jgi:hypothetical protein
VFPQFQRLLESSKEVEQGTREEEHYLHGRFSRLDDSGDVEKNMCDQPSGFIHMFLRNC